MEKRMVIQGIIGLLILLLLLSGCIAQKRPTVICNAPYIRHGDACCIDQNSNSLCDDDEDSGTLYAPSYAPVNDLDVDVTSDTEEEEYKVLTPTKPAEVKTVEAPPPAPEKVTVKPTYTSTQYTAPKPRPNWKASNDFMSVEVTELVLKIVPVTPKDLISPDKEVYLDELTLNIENKVLYQNPSYVYLHPKIHIRVGDDFDPRIVEDTLLCDASDDLKTTGCERSLESGKSMNVTVKIGQKLTRMDVQKTFILTLENRRDTKSANVLEIKEEFYPLKFAGATYI